MERNLGASMAPKDKDKAFAEEFLPLFFAFARDPKNALAVFPIADLIYSSSPADELQARAERLMTLPAFRKLWDRRLELKIDAELVATLGETCDEGTLGRCFATFMQSEGFSPEWFPPLQTEDPVLFLRNRVRMTHDILHVVLGFGTDPAGEIAIQAAAVAQGYGTAALSIIAGFLVDACATRNLPESRVRTLMEALIEGFRIGKESAPFTLMPWEEHWNTPLTQVRSALGITVA